MRGLIVNKRYKRKNHWVRRQISATPSHVRPRLWRLRPRQQANTASPLSLVTSNECMTYAGNGSASGKPSHCAGLLSYYSHRMPQRLVLTALAYGALAAALLCCLWIIQLAPIHLGWGRELVGAAIAIVAMTAGLQLARYRREASSAESRRKDDATTAPPPRAAETAPSATTPFSCAPFSGADSRLSAPEPGVDGLSPREQQVLRHLVSGLTNKQIARELTLSENTVKTHLANVYAKLGVGRRVEALKVARERGLA
ncbi:MAG: response regulator transcription factor [Rhodanobacteraceae bacterium]|nr:response regulator transcription factor [Rhodanobacteraceae bacterium]